jgi:hypothetical protein
LPLVKFNSGTLIGFERLVAQGSGTLALNGGSFSFDTTTILRDLNHRGGRTGLRLAF